MKKGHLETIKKRLLPYIVNLYQEKKVYIVIIMQETNEKKVIAGKGREPVQDSSFFSVSIEMIHPSGIILKNRIDSLSIKKITRKIKEMLLLCENSKGNELGKRYYESVCKITKRNDIKQKEKEVVLPKNKVKIVLENLNSRMEKKNDIKGITCTSYCLQMFEWNLLLNSSGGFLYTQNNCFSIRQTIYADMLTMQLSLCGKKLDGRTQDNLYKNLYQRYGYKLNLLKRNISMSDFISDSIPDNLKIEQYKYLVFDFDLFGTILHEGIGHALESSYSNKFRKNKVYQQGEQLECTNVSIYDSAKASDWVNTEYDCYGNKRNDITLIENGEVVGSLTGIMNHLIGDIWNYCDRKEKPDSVAQNRMTTIHMAIKGAVQDRYDDLLDLFYQDSELLSNAIFLFGSKMGEYNFGNTKMTIFPEIVCTISKEEIQLWKMESLTLNPKEAISAIVNGYGHICESYGFCSKNKQKVATSSILNQFIVTNNFIGGERSDTVIEN